MPNVTTIESTAFFSSTSLNLDLPDTLQYVGNNAFQDVSVDIIMSDTLASKIGNWADRAFDLFEGDILCKGDVEKCQTILSEYIYDVDYQDETGYACPAQANNSSAPCIYDSSISALTDMSKCGNGYEVNAGKCVKKAVSCGTNYRLSDGICYRIRYTPAEAAEVAGESNTIFLYYK